MHRARLTTWDMRKLYALFTESASWPKLVYDHIRANPSHFLKAICTYINVERYMGSHRAIKQTRYHLPCNVWRMSIPSIHTWYKQVIQLTYYRDVIMSAMASHITGASIVYSTVCSGADQRKHQSFASLVFVRGIHWWPVNFRDKGPVTRKMFPFDDVIMV